MIFKLEDQTTNPFIYPKGSPDRIKRINPEEIEIYGVNYMLPACQIIPIAGAKNVQCTYSTNGIRRDTNPVPLTKESNYSYFTFVDTLGRNVFRAKIFEGNGNQVYYSNDDLEQAIAKKLAESMGAAPKQVF